MTPKDDSPSPLIIIETTPENNSSEIVPKDTSKDELIEILKAMLLKIFFLKSLLGPIIKMCHFNIHMYHFYLLKKRKACK